MKIDRTKKLIFLSSVVTLFYFLILLSISYFQLKNVIISVFAQILTIPFLVILLFLTFVSIKNWSKEKFKFTSIYLSSTTINLITIILLILATVFDS